MSYPTADDDYYRYTWDGDDDWEDDEVEDISPEPIMSPNLGIF
jgi:hypothetical protein